MIRKRYDFKEDPETLDSIFKAIIGLKNDGVLDLRSIGGKRWQLTEKFDRPDVPTIAVADITKTKYPQSIGTGQGVVSLTLACTTPTATIKYKLDDGEEQTYEEPIELSSTGEHSIVAWSVIGTTTSASEKTEAFTIAKVINTQVWSAIASAVLTYSKTSVGANGEAVNKTGLAVRQTKITTYVNSNEQDLSENLDVEPTITGYTNTDGANTDTLTIAANDTASTKAYTPGVAFTANNVEGSATCSISQAAATIGLDVTSKSVGANASSFVTNISTTGNVTITGVESSDTNVATVSRDGNAVTVSVKSCTSASKRNCTIKVKSSIGDVTCSISQDAATLSLSASSKSNVAAAGISNQTFTISTTGTVTDIVVSADEDVTATLSDGTVTWSMAKNKYNVARTKKIYVNYKIGGVAQTAKQFSISQVAKVYEAYYGYIPSSVTGFTSKAGSLLANITNAHIQTAIQNGTMVKAASLPITEANAPTIETSGKYGYFFALVYEYDSRTVKQFDGLSAYVEFDDADGYFSNGDVKRTYNGDTFKVYATYAATSGSEYKITIQ